MLLQNTTASVLGQLKVELPTSSTFIPCGRGSREYNGKSRYHAA
jgi:hypothetical protein